MMTLQKSKKDGGFVALITAITLSLILITVAVSLNQTGFLTRSAISDSEYKSRSTFLAEACVDSALLKLSQDLSYAGGENNIAVGFNVCSIGTVMLIAGQITINTSAVFPPASVTSQGAITKLHVVVDSGDLRLLSWNEIP